jgi:hypothetical protein
MKARKFENVELDQIVTFEEEGMIETGVVFEVKENTFTLRALRMWDDNGVKSFYERYYTFLKTGTKSHYRHTHGNAIQITGRI